MLIEASFTTMIDAIVWCCFTEITFNDAHTLLDKASYFILIPLHCSRIGKIQHSIFIRHSAIGIFHIQAFIYDFIEISVLRYEIWQLPQTYVESVFLQCLQHTHRVRETCFIKLIITLPVGSEPACIKMYHISGYLM